MGVTLEWIMGIIQIKDSSKVPIFVWESMGIFEVSELLGTVLLGSDQYHWHFRGTELVCHAGTILDVI